jgi:hypothetical protein
MSDEYLITVEEDLTDGETRMIVSDKPTEKGDIEFISIMFHNDITEVNQLRRHEESTLLKTVETVREFLGTRKKSVNEDEQAALTFRVKK